MQGRNNLGGGADIKDVIKGIYEECKVASGGSVKTGDFVKYINSFNDTGKIIQKDKLTNYSLSSSKGICATSLSETKIAIAFYISKPYVLICDITEDGIIAGSATILKTGTNNAMNLNIAITALTENLFCVVYSFQTSTGAGFCYIYQVNCTVSDRTITVGTAEMLGSNDSNSRMYPCVDVVTLSSNKVLTIYHGYSNSKFLYGRIITINGINSNSRGTAVQISSGGGTSWQRVKAVALSKTLAVVLFEYAGSELRGVACAIGSTSFVIGSYKTISTDSSAYSHFSVAKINENKAIIVYFTGIVLKGVISTINSSNVLSLGTPKVLDASVTSNSYTLDIVRLNETAVSIIYDTNHKYCQSLCSINDNTISVKKTLQLTSVDSVYPSLVSSVALNERRVFIVYVLSEYLNGVLSADFLDKFVNSISSKDDRICGIALNSGQSGENVTIAKPDVN